MKPKTPKLQKRSATRKAWSAFALLACLAPASACRQEPPTATPLEGQWMLRMEMAEGPGGRPYATRGMVIFHPGLPRYPDDPEPSDSTSIGRAYIDLRPGVPHSGHRFQEGEGADRIETAHVFLRGTQVVIHLAPHVKDASPVLMGSRTRDGIAGTWHTTIEGGPPIRGSFKMMRARAREYSDSAAARAARGVQAWNAS